MVTIEKAKVEQFDKLIKIWEASVRATHDFLPEEDIERLKPLIRNEYMPQVNLFVAINEEDTPIGFIGTYENRIEMLFVDSDFRGQGIGSILLRYAIDSLKVNEVDVNEQNIQGVGFYQHMGFIVASRSETDGEGKPYPLLTLKYQK